MRVWHGLRSTCSRRPERTGSPRSEPRSRSGTVRCSWGRPGSARPRDSPGNSPSLTLPRMRGRVREGASGLLRLDDSAADRPGAGEKFLQLVALAPADRALKRGQVFGEALHDLEHRFAIVEKDVPPHHGIRGGYAGKVAKAAG